MRGATRPSTSRRSEPTSPRGGTRRGRDVSAAEGPVGAAGTAGAVPVAPSLGPTLAHAGILGGATPADRRVLVIGALAMVVAAAAGLVAQVLIRLIGFITNLSFYGRFSPSFASAAGNHLGWWVLLVTVAGGLVVVVIAGFGFAGGRV